MFLTTLWKWSFCRHWDGLKANSKLLYIVRYILSIIAHQKGSRKHIYSQNLSEVGKPGTPILKNMDNRAPVSTVRSDRNEVKCWFSKHKSNRSEISIFDYQKINTNVFDLWHITTHILDHTGYPHRFDRIIQITSLTLPKLIYYKIKDWALIQLHIQVCTNITIQNKQYHLCTCHSEKEFPTI